MAKPCAVSGVVTITPSLVIINSYRTKGYVTNHCTIGFSNQGERLWTCFFTQQINCERRDNLLLAFREGTQMNLANIVTIEACCYSDTGH